MLALLIFPSTKLVLPDLALLKTPFIPCKVISVTAVMNLLQYTVRYTRCILYGHRGTCTFIHIYTHSYQHAHDLPLQTHSDVHVTHACARIPCIYKAHMTVYAVDSRPGSHNPFVKPLSPKILTSHFTTVANPQ